MGRNSDPITLHKYLYANVNPVNNIDPSGNFSIGSVMKSVGTMAKLGLRAYNVYSNVTLLMDITKGDVTLTEAALTFAIARFLPRAFFKCRNSFTADTLVHTEFGLKAISEIQIGDKVWSYNTETGEKTLQDVIHLVKGVGEKELVNIELITDEVIESTANHPFFLYDAKRWVEAKDIAAGESLFGLDGINYSVKQVSSEFENKTVYNLSIANDHNYYVSETGILAHNCYQNPKSIDYKKHVPKKKWSRQETIDATKDGKPAMYFMKGTDNIQKFELEAWKRGIPTTNGRPWKVVEFPEAIGANNGKAVRWLRLEYSAGGDVIHGHPISLEQYRKLLR